MEEKKAIKISFSTALLVIALIIICVMSFYIYNIYNQKNLSEKEVISLQNTVDNLQLSLNELQNKVETSNSLDNTTNTNNSTDTNDINNNTNISNNGSSNNMSASNSTSNSLFDTISYMTVEIADTQSGSYDGTYLKPVTISDTNTINKFIDMTSNCEEYTNFYDELGAGDYFEGNPIVIIHQSDGKTFYLTAVDNFHINDEITTNIVDIRTVNNYSKENQSFTNEVVYKINSNFEAFLNEIYNNNK